MSLKKEDYEEPCCPLNMHPEVTRIPLGRALERLDSLLAKRDFSGAERHLLYWIAEADAANDTQGKLSLINEQIGFYRKQGEKDKCFSALKAALRLQGEIGLEDTVTGATTFLNAATGYKAFGAADMALPLYEKARVIYERELSPNDERLAGLYNNMALALLDLSKYLDAEELFTRAIMILEKQEFHKAEIAISYLNLADLITAQYGSESGEGCINNYLDMAEAALDAEGIPRDGYYAFVCEKCAPIFGFYNRPESEQKYAEIAREIYERS